MKSSKNNFKYANNHLLIYYFIYRPENEEQPKLFFVPNESSVKINNTSHFNHNPELKSFIEGYKSAKPNLSLMKIVDPDYLKEIEKVIARNDEFKTAPPSKIQKTEKVVIGLNRMNKITPAQAASKLGPSVTVHRLIRNASSPSIINKKNIIYRN